MDNLVRSAVQAEVESSMPSASVRATLLAEAAAVGSRSAVGPAIPALVNGVREPVPSALSGNRSLDFSGQTLAEQWLMMVVPVYAIR